ncbi:MAG: hypothetical protein HW413_2886, partial [Thermoleophilia bacterium]|nr:hypothetical protein [Thermoleophilia bacterium]
MPRPYASPSTPRSPDSVSIGEDHSMTLDNALLSEKLDELAGRLP